MLKIGITGGIGSGKSTACLVFEKLGIPIYNSDKRAKDLMVEDEALVDSIKSTFGNEVYSGKELNRSVLAGKVFKSKDELEKLNSLVHPAVGRDYKYWLSQYKEEKYTIKEAALLFEVGIYRTLDKVIMVTCPLEERLNRVMKRDGIDRKAVLNRINNQWTEEEKLKLADYFIYNDGSQLLIPQVLKIHKEILALG